MSIYEKKRLWSIISLISTNWTTTYIQQNDKQNIPHRRGTVPESNVKIEIPNTRFLDLSLFWLGTGISIKSGRVKLVWRSNHTFLVTWLCIMKYDHLRSRTNISDTYCICIFRTQRKGHYGIPTEIIFESVTWVEVLR